MLDLLIMNAIWLSAAAFSVWIVSLPLRDTSIVDIAWGLFFVLVASLTFGRTGGTSARAVMVLVMVGCWGVRLALHIGLRSRGRSEDARYAAWRAQHGESWPIRSLVTVFLLQAGLAWIISLPVQIAIASSRQAAPPGLIVFALLLWATGFVVEVVADAQLSRFRRRRTNRDEILTTGLWRFSRHPNYFGDALLWWGIWLMAAPLGPAGLATVISPVLLTALLMRVSGVPMMDKLLEERPGYPEYVRRTSAFFPRPPSGS